MACYIFDFTIYYNLTFGRKDEPIGTKKRIDFSNSSFSQSHAFIVALTAVFIFKQL